jgi:hypothetical protein
MERAATRYRFVRDDDGHTYLIPATEQVDFSRWLAAGPYWDNYSGKAYHDCRIYSSSVWTFIDPQEDE